jgi:predicted ATPase
MLVVNYRPTELSAGEGEHPLREIARELVSARLAEEMALGSLDAADVATFLQVRFAGAALPEAFARRLHQRTGGHALFLVHLVDHLVEQGVLAEQHGRWALREQGATWTDVLDKQVPRSVRAMIEAQLERLDADERRVLEAAAVAGVECGAAAVAGALGDADVARVEQVCDELGRRQRFLVPCGVAEWADGTVASRFRFVHELFHNVVYEQIGPARRTQAHRSLGERIEAAWGERAAEQSAELAMHFERGRDWPRAARHLRHAADAAARQYAHREAIDYLRRALAAIERLGASDRAAAGELPVLVSLGVNLQIVHGSAAAEVEQVFARAGALCGAAKDQADDIQKFFPVLWGVWVFHKVRSDLGRAAVLARELLELARRANDPALLIQAHQAACVTALCQGNPALTVDHMRQAEAIYDPAKHPANTPRFGQDPGVACLAFGAVALALLGRDDEALAASDRALALARDAAPSTRAIAWHFTAMLHQLRGDAKATARHAQAELKVATDEGFSFWRAGGTIFHGWAAAAAARGASEGIDEIRRGLEAWGATGSRTYQPYYLGLLGDALLRHDRIDEAAATIEQALAAARALPEGLYEAELLRLSAEISSRRGARAEATARLTESAAIAKRQGAVRFAAAAAAGSAALRNLDHKATHPDPSEQDPRQVTGRG